MVQIVTYLSSIMTDHRALYMVIDFHNYERGKGFWKMNTSLLSETDFLNTINTEIQMTTESSQEKDPCTLWEILKTRIKKKTMEYSRKKSSEDKLIIAQLAEKVNEYEARLPLVKEEDDLLTATKFELEDKMMERAKGLMFRSKVRWYEQGEKNTKYFYALEKTKYNAKTCFKIINEEQEEIEDPQEILEVQRKFYEDLYSKDENVEFTMNNTTGITVPEPIQKNQDVQITTQELETAIKKMNNCKTPGEDGLPIEIYKVFWNQLKEPFYNMVLQCYKTGIMHESARKGILNLIPKANKDTRFVKNLRPITLLNTDYKIIEKAIANKIIPALEHIIYKDQRGFMEDRRISVNIRKMLDIMHQVEKEDLEAIVMSLDFVKCFDKCSFSILHGSLEYFGFGNIVQDWTKILYRDFTVKIQNNGYFSSPIEIKKGVHQGGCCSAVYFLVIAEILAISLRENTNIDGITIKDIKNLLNQFADDMDIFSLCNEKSLKAIHEELEKFKWQSGFTVSYEKTTIYRIGSLRHSNAQLYDMNQFTWSNQDINVLGITIAHEEILDKNYQQMVKKTEGILNSWTNRGLSLIGKIQVVNTLVASLFVYKMMVLPTIPQQIIKKIDNVIRQYIWNGKKAKISYKTLQNPKDQGGLNLVDLKRKDRALKATWPKILAQEQEYSDLVYSQLRVNNLKENIWRCSLRAEDVSHIGISNQFWEDVLRSWCEFNSYHMRRTENQIIWYNSNIRVKGKPFFWKDIYEKGLMYVHQLFCNGTLIPSLEAREAFGLTELRYNSLKSAIPVEWRRFFAENVTQSFFPLPPHNYDKAFGEYKDNLTRQVYKSSADDILLCHNKYIKWREELGENFCEGILDFGKRHMDIYRITNIAKFPI